MAKKINVRKEKKRLNNMCCYEKRATKEGYQLIAGVDEAGRGSWAGPVVAAAVILPLNVFISGLNDSKKVSPQQRELLYSEIYEKAISVSTGSSSESLIDSVNILNATYIAMGRAINNLHVKPHMVFIDGRPVPRMGDFEQISIIKGDSKSISIAAASIIAKVSRDREMVNLAAAYGQYGFHKNKGYGTKEHREALKAFGICKIHRKSYKPVKELVLNKKDKIIDLWN